METKEDLNRLLLWLGEDTVVGARKYEEIRRKLVVLFRMRGCSASEELTDETIDRTARALLKPEFSFEGSPIAYFRGVARNVYLEWLRRERRMIQEPIEDSNEPAVQPGTDDPQLEKRFACLDRCLERLPEERRELLLSYYQGEKRSKIHQRQQLAAAEGAGMNALRLQVFRMRRIVRTCVETCIRHHEM
jgi:RNA polymerase sigma factor (sigma-70 family)